MQQQNQQQAVGRLSHRLGMLLGFRLALRWTTIALLAWGTVVLVLRLVFQVSAHLLIPGLLVLPPLVTVAIVCGWRRRPSRPAVCASIDRHNRFGGLLMAGEQTPLGPWAGALPRARLPHIAWDSGRPLTLLAIATLYVATVLLLPDRYTMFRGQKTLEVGRWVEELSAQLETLEQEKILESPQTAEIQEKLAQLKDESSGSDPAKTWEALDHLQKTASDSAQRSAEEALARLETLNQAETLAAALALASPSNLNEQVSSQVMRELGALLQNAKIEDGVLAGTIPPELLAALKTNGLSGNQLGQLLQTINSSKGRLGESLTNLANLKLIDAQLVAKCLGACQGGDSNALASFLAECSGTNGWLELRMSYGRGGRDRGRGDAPMTWSEGTSEDDAQFKEQVLPRLSAAPNQEAQLVGVSRAAPQVADARQQAGSGALQTAARGGGAGQSQVLLPRHRDAVQNFFKREN